MSKKNPEYDFLWCPGCGDFGVRRAVEQAVGKYSVDGGRPIENTVVVAGIGCSGNMVHMLEGPQPFGIHGVHGRTLPMAFGIKMANPELNVLVVAGDGDFLSIGAEHIGPQAHRNLNVTCVVMDNAVYGLTKGQSSPTTDLGEVTSTTPFGKLEDALNPLELYLSLGVSFLASAYSSRVQELSDLIVQAMAHPGLAIVHVQSPCTTYNNTHEIMRGNPAKGIQPLVFPISDSHDPTNRVAAYQIARSEGVPLGVLYRDPASVPLEQRVARALEGVTSRSLRQLVDSFAV